MYTNSDLVIGMSYVRDLWEHSQYSLKVGEKIFFSISMNPDLEEKAQSIK